MQLLTPPGRSAVATIEVTGGQAATIVAALFRRANQKPLTVLNRRSITYGTWSKPNGSTNDQPAGEGVVVAQTHEERWEIHCHGGSVAAERIIRDLVTAGCTQVTLDSPPTQPSDITLEREARLALSDALTEHTALILLDQLNGALRTKCNAVSEQMQASHDPRNGDAERILEELLASYQLGQHLTKPWQVVLAGPANVGKSSLINALVGYERAIVFNQPGTTRDVVTALTAIEGWPVELADTAGMRAAESSVEATGIERARERFVNADVAILVSEVGQPNADALLASLRQLRPDALWVANKSDLAGDLAATPAPNATLGNEAILTSATEGDGIDRLLSAIASTMLGSHPHPSGQPLLFTSRQQQIVAETLTALRDGNIASALQSLAKI